MKIAHIINPVDINPESDIHIAQPITFETMRIAKDIAISNGINVEQYATTFIEDNHMIPEGMIATKNLTKSLYDFTTNEEIKKLPLISEILNRVYLESDADYVIYTNVDIALMPHFYLSVKSIIDNGHDSFSIFRRSISDKYTSIKEIPEMYMDIGANHGGTDCFVFRRELIPKFKFENIVIGALYFAFAFSVNLYIFSKNMKDFKIKHLTFHIGTDSDWPNDLRPSKFNEKEMDDIMVFFIMNYNNHKDMKMLIDKYNIRKQKRNL